MILSILRTTIVISTDSFIYNFQFNLQKKMILSFVYNDGCQIQNLFIYYLL